LGAVVNVQKTKAGTGKLFKAREEKFSRVGARTRWVTERIAPIGTAPKSIRRNERLETRRTERLPGSTEKTQKRKKWEQKAFYLLTPALMGDPFPDDNSYQPKNLTVSAGAPAATYQVVPVVTPPSP
jgi:hypothetical protein